MKRWCVLFVFVGLAATEIGAQLLFPDDLDDVKNVPVAANRPPKKLETRLGILASYLSKFLASLITPQFRAKCFLSFSFAQYLVLDFVVSWSRH